MGSLDFDGSRLLYFIRERLVEKSYKVQRRNFVNNLNRVLKLHQGHTIDEFRVCFDLDGQKFK